MTEPVRLDPDALYDGGTLYLILGLTAGVLARARKSGDLRFTRKGNRTLYLGAWVLDWLKADCRREATP